MSRANTWAFVVHALGSAIALMVCAVAACGNSYNGEEDPDVGLPDRLDTPDASNTEDARGVEDTTADNLSPLPRGAHLFSRSFGGAEQEYLSRMNVDHDGNLLLAGTFASQQVDFFGSKNGPISSAGLNDAYFAKLDKTGKVAFVNTYGDADEQNGVNMVETGTGDLYVSGVYKGKINVKGVEIAATDAAFDAFILRLAADGSVKETNLLTGPQMQIAFGLAFDGSLGVFYTGQNLGMMSTTTTPPVNTNGGSDVMLGLANATQNWAAGFGDAADQQGSDVAYDPAGSIVAVGSFAGSANFGDGMRTSVGGVDAYVMRRAAGGAPVWSKAFGAVGDQRVGLVKITTAGEILVAGTFAGTFSMGGPDLVSVGAVDFFLAKLNADGSHVWSKRFGGLAEDDIHALALAPNGDILIAGKTFGPMDFGLPGFGDPGGDADAFVARLDKDGNPIWAKRFGDAAFQTAQGVGVTPNDEVWFAGYYQGSIDLGGGPLSAVGKNDVFIARFTH